MPLRMGQRHKKSAPTKAATKRYRQEKNRKALAVCKEAGGSPSSFRERWSWREEVLLRQRLVAVVLLGDGDAQEDELGQNDICK